MTLSDWLAVIIIILQAVLVAVMLNVRKTFSAYTQEMERTHSSNLMVLERLQEVIDNPPQEEKSA